jgi:hypothetical protein
MVTHFSLDDPKTESHLDSADLEEKVLDEEFLKTIKDNLTEWKSHFNKEQEKKVLDAVILIFDNCKNIDICDRKAIFFYIKEITGLKYVQIASNLSKIKKKYTYLKKKYKRGEI